eukprot:g25291.t1
MTFHWYHFDISTVKENFADLFIFCFERNGDEALREGPLLPCDIVRRWFVLGMAVRKPPRAPKVREGSVSTACITVVGTMAVRRCGRPPTRAQTWERSVCTTDR